MTTLAIVVICSLFAACGQRVHGTGDAGGDAGDDGGGSNTQPHTLSAIEVTPTNPILELDLSMPGSQTFAAMGRFLDGNDLDISDRVNWSVVNPTVGTMTGPRLDIPGFAALTVESSRIRAELDGINGEAQITIVAYRRSGSSQDFFFVLPYLDPAGPIAKPLDFGTTVPALDVFFLMDTTGSMIGEITTLQNALTSTVVPGIQASVADTQFGAGSFEDFPVDYGSLHGADCGHNTNPNPDQPLRVFQTITNNIASVQTAVGQYSTGGAPIGCGGDWPEAGIEGLYQVATGSGLTGPAPTNVPPNTTGIGGVGYRAGTMPVVVTVTDALMHGPGEGTTCTIPLQAPQSAGYVGPVGVVAHTRNQAKAALANICARSVGIASFQPNLPSSCSGQADLEDFAMATGARVPPTAWDVGARPAGCAANECCTNIDGTGRATDLQGLCPLVFLTDGAGNGLGANIVTGIQMLTRFGQFSVTSDRQGVTTDTSGSNPLPAPHTTADFIKQVIPTGFMVPPAPPVVPNPAFNMTTFVGVTPGTRVQFDVKALNDFLPQTANAQIFRATIRVLAGGCTALDQREVLILVPPSPIIFK